MNTKIGLENMTHKIVYITQERFWNNDKSYVLWHIDKILHLGQV